MQRPRSARQRVRLVLVTVGLVAATLVGAPTLAHAATAPPAPNVVTARTTSAVDLTAAAGTLTPVETISLGAGAWTVSSDVTAINFGAGDFVRCELSAADQPVDGGSTVFLANRVAGLTDVGALIVASTETVGVYCDHDHTSTTGQIYIDPGATITAVKGGPISYPGHKETGATVVQVRTTTATTLPVDSGTLVASTRLTAGTWALTANATAVNFGGFDFDSCELGFGTHGVGFMETGTDGTDAAAQGIDIDYSVTIPSGGAIASLYCGATENTSDYIDVGATLTATKVAPAAQVAAQIGITNLPQNGGLTRVVATQTIPAGAWRIRTGVQFANYQPNGAVAPGRDFMRCTLEANGKAIDGGATVLLTPDSYVAELVNAGTFTATASWTLTLVCSHDSNHTGAGHWAALDGQLLAVNKGPISGPGAIS